MSTVLSLPRTRATTAFSLIELLIVIAIIGVLASLVIASFSNATQDSRNVVVLQQQAALQEALNSWIAHESSSSGSGSLHSAKASYAAATTGASKLALISPYLDAATAAQFTPHSTIANALNSDTMEKTQHYVAFSTWPAGSYPKIILY